MHALGAYGGHGVARVLLLAPHPSRKKMPRTAPRGAAGAFTTPRTVHDRKRMDGPRNYPRNFASAKRKPTKTQGEITSKPLLHRQKGPVSGYFLTESLGTNHTNCPLPSGKAVSTSLVLTSIRYIYPLLVMIRYLGGRFT